jgi:hypothetical protein
MAHGAALAAGNITSTVQLKPIWLQDLNTNEFKAEFRDPENPKFHKSTTIFKQGAKLNSKKKVTFQHRTDLQLIIEYGATKQPITRYNVTGITDAARMTEGNVTNSFIFNLDLSGIPTLSEAESKYVKQTESKKKGSDEVTVKNKTIKYPCEFKHRSIEIPAVINGT